MAISGSIVWEVQTGGSDTAHGGGFKTGASGTDYSTTSPTAPQATLSTASVVNATTSRIDVAVGDYTVGAGDVGNILQVTGGSATAGFYEITGINAGGANQWTLDRAVGTAGQTVVGGMGGALATPGKAAPAASVDGNKIWVKAGTYTLSTTTPGAAGPVVFATDIRVFMEGYQTTRGDRGTRPVISAGSQTSINIFKTAGNDTQIFTNMEADANNGAGVICFAIFNAAATSPHFALNCLARNASAASTYGFNLAGGSGSGSVIGSVAINCSVGFRGSGVMNRVDNCWADGCAVGFNTNTGGMSIAGCLASDCTDDGFQISIASLARNCTADGNGGDGFSGDGMYVDCAATNNTAFGFNTTAKSTLQNCADYNNSARTNTAPFFDFNPITLTGDPWVNAASDDYAPNTTSGAGLSLRNVSGVGLPGQSDTHDIGAVHHADPANATANLLWGKLG